MADNELLKFAGIAFTHKSKNLMVNGWDPLNNQSEAMKLKESLNIGLREYEEELTAPRFASACYEDEDGYLHWFHEQNPNIDGQIDGVVRRVIVKAAADMGKKITA